MHFTRGKADKAQAVGELKQSSFAEVEAFTAAREKQAELEIGDSEARVAAAEEAYKNGAREVKAFVGYVERTTRLDSALLGVHNETRALLMESGLGAAVVFGSRRSGWSPLGELLLATHQLDWRLGERCIGLHRTCQDLASAARDVLDKHGDIGGKSLALVKARRADLHKSTAVVDKKRAIFRESRPSNARRDDLWFAENELRVACRVCSQQQQTYVQQARETVGVLETLERWRDAALKILVQTIAEAVAVYRDDLKRVGERLVSVAEQSACLNESDDDSVGLRLKAARMALPHYSETREQFRDRQAAVDATAKSKGALVFPPMPSDATVRPKILQYPPPPTDDPPNSMQRDDASSSSSSIDPTPAARRAIAEAACGPIPTMPPSRLIARSGAMEFERNVALGAGSLGWIPVFLVLTLDGFLSGFPGRTEGSSQTDPPIFRTDLMAATVHDEDEGPIITLVTRPKSNITAFVVGDRHIRLKAKDAADKFAWLQCLNDPLADFSPPAQGEKKQDPTADQPAPVANADAPTAPTSDGAVADSNSNEEQGRAVTPPASVPPTGPISFV